MAAEVPPEQKQAALKDKYLEKLMALKGFGFKDEAASIQALEDAKGSLEGAAVLLSKRAQMAPASGGATSSSGGAAVAAADDVARGKDKERMGDEAPMDRVPLTDLIRAFPKIDRDTLRVVHQRYQGEYEPIMAEIKEMSSG
jgi:hypothetical protein